MSAVLKEVKRQPRMTVLQEVEVDIADFDDDALLAELDNRNLGRGGDGTTVDDLFAAMAIGNHAKALELLREYLMNVTGRILP